MNKRVWKLIFILIPLFMCVMTLYYSNTIIHHFEESVYTNVKQEKINAMSIFAQNIDELVNAGFSWESDGALYHSAIQLYIEMLGSDDAAYVALISKCYGIATEQFNCKAAFDLFECEINKRIIIEAIQQNQIGQVVITLGGREQDLYFHAIPLHDVEYWVVIGVDRQRIIERLDINKLRVPIFIIGILFIISTMDSIWQRIIKIRRM